MNSVGIDVSKGRSTVAVMRPLGEAVLSPFEVFFHCTFIIREKEAKKQREAAKTATGTQFL